MNPHKLTQAEEEIMQMLWEQNEPVTVSKLISQMPEPRPPHSTISSIIRILERKGFVDHKTYGRTHVYFPKLMEKEFTLFSITKLVRNYFEGSMNNLVSFLVKEKNLNLKDLTELIDEIEKNKSLK